jgi:hypothetical protein
LDLILIVVAIPLFVVVIIFVLPLLDGIKDVVPLLVYEDTKKSVICWEVVLPFCDYVRVIFIG